MGGPTVDTLLFVQKLFVTLATAQTWRTRKVSHSQSPELTDRCQTPSVSIARRRCRHATSNDTRCETEPINSCLRPRMFVRATGKHAIGLVGAVARQIIDQHSGIAALA